MGEVHFDSNVHWSRVYVAGCGIHYPRGLDWLIWR